MEEKVTVVGRCVMGGPFDSFKRIREGKCGMQGCDGRLSFKSATTELAKTPDWVHEANKAKGFEAGPDEMSVTRYTYRCQLCGQITMTTEKIEPAAVMN